MSWIVKWNGVDYDVDPNEFSTGELKRVKILTGLSYRQLLEGIQAIDAEAIGVLFYIVDWRGDPNLKYDGYSGPPMGLVVASMTGFADAMDELGKALPDLPSPTGTTPTDGSPSSPSTADTPEPSLTL